jgi:hypothetical protein
MSSEVDALSAALAEKWAPQTKQPVKGIGAGNLPTPESTPEPDDGRAAAEERRRAEAEAEQEAIEAAKRPTESQQPGSVKGQPPENKKQTDDDKAEAENRAKILEEVLACDELAHYKILGLDAHYNDLAVEMAAIDRAVYDRGVEVHPNYNEDKNAEKAWNSKFSTLNIKANHIWQWSGLQE